MKFLLMLSITISAFSLSSYGQESEKSQLIRQFYEKVYDQMTSPEQIVQDYIIYGDSMGYKSALASIISFRQPSGDLREHFNILKKDIVGQEFTLKSYCCFRADEKAKFQYIEEEDRVNIYKIKPRNTIQHYLLLRNDKIRSFFGYEKAGSDQYTFLVYE